MKKFAIIALAATAAFAAVSPALAEGGCGWGWHRGPFGGCIRNNDSVAPNPGPVVVLPGGGAVLFAPLGGACPVGYHLGPQGRRCWPN